MALSWGERAEIKRDAVSEIKGQLVDRENRVEERERALAKERSDFNLLKEKSAEIAKHNAEMANKQNELRGVDIEIQQKRLDAKEAGLDLQIQRLNDSHAAELLVKESEWKAQYGEKYRAALEVVETAKAESAAKDKIIASKDGEIARLDELLKVTMSKLTQIDVKGLTIHVENTKPSESSK